MNRLTVILPCLLAAWPDFATPRFLPDQDVAVTYELSSPGNPVQDVQLSFSATTDLARVDSAQGLYVIASLPAGDAQVVIPALRAYVEAPDFSDLARMIAAGGDAQFTGLGHGFYAGLPCEKYLVLTQQGSAVTCLTTQGVILHFVGRDASGSAELTALSVAFAPQPAGRFITPYGFTEVTLPPGALAAMLRGQ